MRRLLVVAIMLSAVLGGALLLGCGGGGGASGGTTGTLRVALTDQGGYDEVVLAIREVRAVPEGEEGQAEGGLPLVASFDPAQVVDIMQLSYRQMELGESDVAPGAYTQLRLVLAPNVNGEEPVNYVVLTGETEHIPLDTPSGQQSGLKINATFTVETGMTTTIVMDFDPSRAIVHTGQGSDKYLLKPTGIRCTETQMTPVYGALAGTVVADTGQPVAQVEAVPQGETEAVANTNVDLAEDGSFRIPLTPGNYFIRVTADGYDLLDTSTLDPAGIYTVTAGQDTAVDELELTPTE